MDLATLFSTFGILFLGELGDKTQLIIFDLSLKYEKSWMVGIGATLGFAVIVTIGVILGGIITDVIPVFIISLVGGIIFIVLGIFEARGIRELWIERKNSLKQINAIKHNSFNQEIKRSKWFSKLSKLTDNAVLSSFLFIFLMELGDKTQILTISLASVNPSLFEIWLGSILALSFLAWLGVFLGALIVKKIPKLYIKLFSSTLFIFIGIILLISNL